LRIAVTIEEPSRPFSVVIYFVHVIDDEINASVSIPVGVELGQRFDRPNDGQPHKSHPIGERLPRPLDRAAVQEVAERLGEYIEYARGCIAIGRIPNNSSTPSPGSRPQGRRRRALTNDFLSLVAEQYETWSAGKGRAVTEIAAAHGVNRSTASRWVQAARDRGLIT
jgi:hypothetical protein